MSPLNDQTRDPDTLGDDPPPVGKSIDRLIGWLKRRREQQPTSPLSELMGSESLSIRSLIEVAATDLMIRRRKGDDVIVETYLAEFPPLRHDSTAVLDLIDAELCVRRELEQPNQLDLFVSRFPEHADAIRQLVHLEDSPVRPVADLERTNAATRGVLLNPAAAVDSGDGPCRSTDGESGDFRLQRDLTVAGATPRRPRSASRTHSSDDSIDVPIPIRPPDWMTGARCVATSTGSFGRSWLVKGRDTERSDTVVMKVIPLPSTLGREEHTRLLDLCEATSSVSNPTWVAPRIAAIDKGHLAVIRPWIFGNPLDLDVETFDADSQSQRLSRCVRVAFALSAAHRVGATHGGVGLGNLIIDHQGNENLVDCASSVRGWKSYLDRWCNDLSSTLADRIGRDARELIALVSRVCLLSNHLDACERLLGRLRGIDLRDPESCAQIGESIQMHLSDTAGNTSWWRRQRN